MSKTDKHLSSESWQASVQVVADFLNSDDKLDTLFHRHSTGLGRDVRRRVQYLTYGVVRNLGRLQATLEAFVRKAPKKRLQAMLLLGIIEYWESEENNRPQVVHSVVEQVKRSLSGAEARFVNAVMRRISESSWEGGKDTHFSEAWSTFYSHPVWMIERWVEQWGEDDTRKFLEWNQSTPGMYAWSQVSKSAIPADWHATDWPEFYDIREADWKVVQSWLQEGRAYIQDPSTRLGASLLEGQAVRSVLDLCSAPGGKSIQLQRYFSEADGLLVSVDIEGPRFKRLQENLSRYPRAGVQQVQVAADVLSLKSDDLPQPSFEVVYLDVPCSNTGVLQRRPDVKWRQTESRLKELIDLQHRLFRKAAEFVQPGGSLIYSTCSVEAAENEWVVDQALPELENVFQKEASIVSLPWQTGHDGAGVSLLRRVK